MKTRQRNPVDKKILVRVLRAENRRLREDLNEQRAWADEYHASLTETYSSYAALKKKKSVPLWVQQGQWSVAPTIVVGKMQLERMKDGILWLQISDNEGMQVNEKELEADLRRFFNKRF